MSDGEKRINLRLISYWEKLKGNKHLPLESDIEPDDLFDIWDDCFMIDVHHKNGKYAFRYGYLGDSLLEAFGDSDESGSDVYELLLDTKDADTKVVLEDLLNDNEPFIQEGEFINNLDIPIKFRRCLLPLQSNTGHVDHILGGMRWKAFS